MIALSEDGKHWKQRQYESYKQRSILLTADEFISPMYSTRPLAKSNITLEIEESMMWKLKEGHMLSMHVRMFSR